MPDCTLTALLGDGFTLIRTVVSDGGVSIRVTDSEGGEAFSEYVAGASSASGEPEAAEQLPR